MTDQPDLPACIEALLAAASPGPWKAKEYNDYGEYSIYDAKNGEVAGFQSVACYPSGCIHDGFEKPDATVIALAPAALQSVAELWRALEGQEDAQNSSDECADCWSDICDLHAEAYIAATEQRRAALRATEERLGGSVGMSAWKACPICRRWVCECPIP